MPQVLRAPGRPPGDKTMTAATALIAADGRVLVIPMCDHDGAPVLWVQREFAEAIELTPTLDGTPFYAKPGDPAMHKAVAAQVIREIQRDPLRGTTLLSDQRALFRLRQVVRESVGCLQDADGQSACQQRAPDDRASWCELCLLVW